MNRKYSILAAVFTAILCTSGCGTPEGENGEMGLIGPEGPQGPQGEVGPAGSAGPQGPTGAAGADGADGTNGSDGVDGATGTQGPAGATGPQGATGPMGPAGPTGSDGSDGAVGPQGPAGPAGADGSDGTDGADGADSTTSFVVKDATGMEVPWTYEYNSTYYYVDQYDLKWRVTEGDSGLLAPADVVTNTVTTYFSGSSCSGSSAVPAMHVVSGLAYVPHGWNGPLAGALMETVHTTSFGYNSIGNGVGCQNTSGSYTQEWVEITFLSEGSMPDLSGYTMPFHLGRPQ